MPTKYRRYALTETPSVQAALEKLRKELGSDKLQLSELVVLGVEKKLERLREERADVVARREGLANWVLTRSIPVDLDAAAEVRQSGWARS